MGETQPGGELQPILCLIVNGRAAGIAFVFRLVDDSTVIEIAHPGKVVEFAVGTGHRSVVFLTERVVESLVIPVVGRVVVFAVAIAQFGIGVELEVAAYKVFACRHGVHLIAQTTVGAVEQVFVGKGVGLGSCGAMIIFGVEHGTVVGLVILAGIADDIILRNQTRVGTKLGFERHACILSVACPFRRDDDHAVGTAGTVDGRGRSVFLHGDAFNVVGVDVGDVGSVVGCAVYDVEWRGACVDRADTAHTQRGSRTGLARRACGLYAGHLTHEGTGRIGGHMGGDLVGLDFYGRTGESRLLGLTVGNHQHIVQHIVVGHQFNLHIAACPHGLALHTDVAHHQFRIGGNRQAEIAVDIGHGAGLCAFNQNGRTDDGLPVFRRSYGATDLCLGQSHSYAEEKAGQKHH